MQTELKLGFIRKWFAIKEVVEGEVTKIRTISYQERNYWCSKGYAVFVFEGTPAQLGAFETEMKIACAEYNKSVQ